MLQSSFVRIVNKELIEFLVEHNFEGSKDWLHTDFSNVEHVGIATSIIKHHGEIVRKGFTLIDWEQFDSPNPHYTWNCWGRVDCGMDVEKFKQNCL